MHMLENLSGWSYLYLALGVVFILIGVKFLVEVLRERKWRDKTKRFGFRYPEVEVPKALYEDVATLLWKKETKKAVALYKRRSGYSWSFAQGMVNQIRKELLDEYNATGKKPLWPEVRKHG